MHLTRLGSDYGGWMVDLDSIPVGGTVLDAGVGLDISFAEALYQLRNTFTVFVDPGHASEEFVKSRNLHCLFLRAAVSDAQGETILHKHRSGGSDSLLAENANSGVVTEVVPCVHLRDLVKSYKPCLVKLDIEGSEYDVYEHAFGVKQVAMEFHHRLLRSKTSQHTKKIIARFQREGYAVIARGDHDEVTFLLK